MGPLECPIEWVCFRPSHVVTQHPITTLLHKINIHLLIAFIWPKLNQANEARPLIDTCDCLDEMPIFHHDHLHNFPIAISSSRDRLRVLPRSSVYRWSIISSRDLIYWLVDATVSRADTRQPNNLSQQWACGLPWQQSPSRLHWDYTELHGLWQR